MPAVRGATGILMDGDGTANTSFNVFDDIYLNYEFGTAVNFANADSNTIGTLSIPARRLHRSSCEI